MFLHTGVANMTFPLSDQPVLGEWFIFVEMQGHVYNKSFEVQKYGKPETLRGSPLGGRDHRPGNDTR